MSWFSVLVTLSKGLWSNPVLQGNLGCAHMTRPWLAFIDKPTGLGIAVLDFSQTSLIPSSLQNPRVGVRHLFPELNWVGLEPSWIYKLEGS